MPLVLVGYSRAVQKPDLEKVIRVLQTEVAKQLSCDEDPVEDRDVVVWPISLGELGVQYTDLGIQIFTGSYPSRLEHLALAKYGIGRVVNDVAPHLSCFVWIHPVAKEAVYEFFPATQ